MSSDSMLLITANEMVEEARQLLHHDKAAAARSLKAAQTAYQNILRNTTNLSVKRSAAHGLSIVHAALNDTSEAARYQAMFDYLNRQLDEQYASNPGNPQDEDGDVPNGPQLDVRVCREGDAPNGPQLDVLVQRSGHSPARRPLYVFSMLYDCLVSFFMWP